MLPGEYLRELVDAREAVDDACQVRVLVHHSIKFVPKLSL